jgi:meiosis-specific protein HOP1
MLPCFIITIIFLQERRFATFKLFYTDKTPSNYEPPHFQAGDAQKDKWYFMTHDFDEIPDRWSIGRVNAGYHSWVFALHVRRVNR